MSLRAFARKLGVNHTAVVKAVREGRLVRSVTRKPSGQPMITDVELALKEWAGQVAPAEPSDPLTAPPPPSAPAEPKTLTAARLQKAIEQVRALRLANDEKAGKLAPVEDMERRFTTRVVAARTRLLGVPSRAKQRLPHLTTADLAVLDELIREALDELSGSPAEQAEAQSA